LALFLKQLNNVTLEDLNEKDDKFTQNWKTIKAYFSSPNKILDLIHASVRLIEEEIISDDQCDIAGSLV